MNVTTDHPRASSPGPDDGDESLFEDLVEEFTDRLQAGDAVDVEAFLDRHPAHAEGLRRLIPSLELMDDLGQCSIRGVDRMAPLPTEPAAGLGELGDFRLIREVGRGGMGVVYEAEQISLRRRVALKVLPFAATLDARQIQRFQVEAQAAACLQHPHIVPVHGVGCERGVHYYAMQLIDGQSLAAMISELRRLDGLHPGDGPHPGDGLHPGDGPSPGLSAISTTTLATRLLAGDAADRREGAGTDPPVVAVSPGRTATERPTPTTGPARSAGSSTHNRDYVRAAARLAMQAAEALDHAHVRGILHRDIKPGNLLLDAEARLWITDFGLAQVRGDDRLTLSGDVLGTLRYMSPEQALGRRVVVDGRTDVYSLGVTLYELLTLRPAVDGRDRAEILRRIADGEPPPLRKVNPAVPADLETIVLKAMNKDPSVRYATAGELAEDLSCFLEHRPIRARRPGLLDQAAKWSRRHRSVVTTSALLLVLGTAVSLWQAMRAAQAEGEARQRAEELRQVVDYLAKDVFGGAAPSKRRGRSVTVGELLDRADATLGERFRRQPLVEASVRLALAETYITLWEHGRAEQNAGRAVQLRERHLGPEHPQTLEALSLQAWYLCTANLNLAAERIARRVLASQRRVLGPAHPDTLSTQSRLAQTLSNLGRHDEAEDLAAELQELAVRFLGPEHDVTLLVPHILGLIAERRGNLARAEALFRQDLEGYERSYGALGPGVLYALERLACVVRRQGRADEARRLHLETVNRFAQVYGLCQKSTGQMIDYLFSLLQEQRDFTTIRDLCEGWIREILAIPPELDKYERHLRSWRIHSLALTLATLPEPVPFDAALAVRAAEESDNPGTIARVYARLGRFDMARQRLAEAARRSAVDPGALNDIAWFLATCPTPQLRDPGRAVELARKSVAKEPRELNWNTLGVAYCRAGDWEAAIEALEKSETLAPDKYLAFNGFFLAMAHWRLGQKDEARSWYDRAVEWMDKNQPKNDELLRFRAEAAALLGLPELPADVFARQ